MRLISLACLIAASLSGPALAMRAPMPGPAGGPYAHALRIAAQRDAFWHAHHVFRHYAETEETGARKAGYWQSQSRGRALQAAFAAE